MKCIILILFLFMEAKCDNNTIFICNDGTTIDFPKVCDGLKDCPDGSDETEHLCFHTLCPSNMFRCYYGACVKKSARCDTKYQCADKSDEESCIKTQNTCSSNQFRCLSHECISKEEMCDGTTNCLDGSDESGEICDLILCPENTFRCKFGGCINIDARCNGIKDCIDGSDESDQLCKALNCSGRECYRILTSVKCSPIMDSKIIVTCKSTIGFNRGFLPCNKPLPINTVARYECKPYYHPINLQHSKNTHSVCQADGSWSVESLKCEPDCGRARPIVVPLVVHGWAVDDGMWPWHAALYTLQQASWEFWCGGSLISERVVITAAHCTWKITADTLRVALGKHFRNYTTVEEFTQILDVEKIIMQPLYQDVVGNYGSDIAILILNSSVKFSPYVSPVCVDWKLNYLRDHLSENTTGMVIGMGITENETLSEIVRAVSLPVISEKKCIGAETKDFRKYVTYTSFCAGWQNGTGVCNGDSGGGLVFPKPNEKSTWILQGIVSVSPRRLGTFFCDPNYYTIFTKVSMYVNWIKKTLKEQNLWN